MNTQGYRPLTGAEIGILESGGSVAESWEKVWVKEGFDPHRVKRSEFYGEVRLGTFRGKVGFNKGFTRDTGIIQACIHQSVIGDEVYIRDVHNHISNVDIGDACVIQNVNSIEHEPGCTFANGLKVSVLNEAGGREVPLFDHLSAHLAYILVLYRHRPEVVGILNGMIDAYASQQVTSLAPIGANTRISNVNSIRNARIGCHARIEGSDCLSDVSVNSNSSDPVFIGPGVCIRHSVISSGTRISDGALIDHCFVGQGVELGKQYSAENSLFFANCAGFHGEACSVFAGPYTVTHHKSTLLIAAYFSFLNAGSGSNQSNHMYKLGPIHQGIVERGSKTTSDSYLLWPAKVGPFTLVMGRHYKNSDTSDLPFSYLIESNDESILSPGVNLKSVGTIRDAQKWPRRDQRKDPVKTDQINYNLLSPFTIQKMYRGRQILKELQSTSGLKSDFYTFENTRIPRSALERGIELYTMGIHKFLGNSLITQLEKGSGFAPLREEGEGEWVDLAGLIVPQELVEKLLDSIEQGSIASLDDIQQQFVQWHEAYYELEWSWARKYIRLEFGKHPEEMSSAELIQVVERWRKVVIRLDEMLYEDARKEFRLTAQTGFGTDGGEHEKAQDFSQVRGDFEANPAVLAIREHMKRKDQLADRIIAKLKMS